MTLDITFHYPPELLNLLIDTIPRLNRSKKDLFLFFRGAGVSDVLMRRTHDQWRQAPDSINKFDITRQILTALNERGESGLRERREVLKRVVEFDSFSSCWEGDVLKAKGLVAEIQSVVNVKDSFTRMRQEREKERQEHVAHRQAKIEKRLQQARERERIKADLVALFAESDANKRGTALEGVLNRLFQSHGVLIREAFKRVGNAGEGVVEQIDGVIELDGHIYLVEMKWWEKALGVPEVSQHLVRVYHRDAARGILISHSGFTGPAIATCREALVQGVFVLATLQELVLLMEHDGSISEWLRQKVRAAITDKEPLVQSLSEVAGGRDD